MKTKKIYRFMAILLLITLTVQPMQLTKVQAASGAVVTGASGTQYTLDHGYVKQLNINTGNITITDSNYTQVNGLTENWDTNEDAYVITGQGTSTNTITINTTNYPITLYLLETQWSGNIVLGSSSNTASVKIVILGNVSCNKFIRSSYSTTTSKQVIEVHGYSENSNLTVSSLMSGSTSNHIRIGTLVIDGVNLICNKITDIYSSGTSGNMKYWAVFLNNLIIKNSEITQHTATTEPEGRFYFTYLDVDNGSISIEDSTVNSAIALDEGTASTRGLKSVIITNSNISSIIFGKRYDNNYMGYSNTFSITAENSFINNAVFDSNIDTVSLKNTVLKTAVINKQKLYLYGSTVANAGTSLTVPVYSFNHSSFNSYGTNWVLNQTPTDSNANDLFLKKVRFRDYPNTYILVTFQDGFSSKLLTDDNGYLYPYLPRNNMNLQFQITDEKGTANLGNYNLDFDAITSNDTSTSVPTVTVLPTIITFSPYANAEVEYSFNRTDWTSAITDSNCQFSVVLPKEVKKIYVRYNDTLYSVDIDELGNPTGVVELKPEIISQSASNVSLLKGKEGNIYVNARPVNTGADLHFQWYKDGKPLTGETSNVFTLKSPNEIDEGAYTCIVSEDGTGSTTSSPIVITVTDGLPEETVLGILAQSGNKKFTEDSRVEIYVIPNKVESVSYQWKKDGTDIAGANSAIYEVTSVKQAAEGTYTCVLTKGNEVITSAPIVISIEPNPLSGDISNLQDAVDALTTQLDTLQDQLDSADNNLSALQNTIDHLTSQITDLNNQIAALQGQINNLNGNVTELQNQIKALQEQKNNLQTELDSTNVEKAGLQVIINELNIEISNKDTQIINLQLLLETTENENNGLNNQIAFLNIQINDMSTRIESLNTQVTTLSSQRDYLQSQLNATNATISTLQQKILDLSNENVDLKSQLESVLLQINILQEEVNSLTTQNTSLVNQVNGLEEQITILQNKLDGAGEDTSELLQQISNLINQVNNLTTIINQKDTQITSLNEQITNLNTTIVNMHSEVNDAMESLSEYEGIALLDKINQVLSENVRLKEDLTALKQERSTLLSQITDLNNFILELQGENTSLSQQLQEAEDLINNLQNNLTTEISKSNSLQTLVDTLNNKINELQKQLDQYDSSKDELMQQINVLQVDLSDITKQLQVSNQTTAELNSQITGLDTTIKNLQSQINNALSELSEYEGNDLMEKIKDIKTKQSNITADLDEANDLNTRLNSQLNTVNMQVLSLQYQIDILTGQLSDKDEKITELLSLIARKNDEISGKNSQIGNLENQVQTLQATLDSVSGGNDAITKLAQQVNDLTNQINTLNDKISGLTGKIADKDTLINHLNKQLDAKNTEISNLYKQIEVLQNSGSGQAEVVKLQTEITKLSDKLDKANDVINDLQKQLEELKKNPVTVVNPDDNTAEDSSKNSDKINIPVFTMYKTIYLNYDYRVQLSNASGYDISYHSTDNSVAKVNKKGLITSVSKGRATITCTVGTSYIYKIVVTIEDGKGKATLNLNTSKIQTTSTPVLLMYKQVKKGASTKIKISGLDENSEVTYMNTNSKVAVISKDGTILGVNKGDTDVLAIVTQGNLLYIYYIKIRVDDGTKDVDMWEYLTES